VGKETAEEKAVQEFLQQVVDSAEPAGRLIAYMDYYLKQNELAPAVTDKDTDEDPLGK